ncbi:MAG TPA: nuclear transport factor 2 family protein [Actinomycetota bacterium]|nr:nuclear transport factor 2 family protein [Actinomycetota bacterium]
MTKKFRYLSEGEPEGEPAPKASKASGKKASAAKPAESKAAEPAPAGGATRRKRATSFSAAAPEPEPELPAPAPAEAPAPARRRRSRAPEPEPVADESEPEIVAAPGTDEPAVEADFILETIATPAEPAEEEEDFSASTFRRRPRPGRKKTAETPGTKPAAKSSAPAPEPEPASEVIAAEGKKPVAAEPAPSPVRAAPPPPPPPPAPKQPSRREVNEGIVRSLFAARDEGDESALRRLLSDEAALILPGGANFIGREAVLGAWVRQAELLDQSLAFEADLRSIAASDDHVFTYVETWAEAPSSRGVSFTTLTSYRIRGGQVAEVRQHVDDVEAYEVFWLALGQAAS